MKLAALHLDNLLFFLLVAVAMLFRWLASAANKAGQSQRPNDETERRSTSSTSTPPPVPRMQEETDTDRMRKFLEALGQPPGTTPPPRRPTYQKPLVLPHVPPFASPLPPLKTRPPDLPRKIAPPVVIAPSYEIERRPPLPTTTTTTTTATTTATKSEDQPRANPLLALLRSSSGLRDAVVLREVFGPPRGLQDVDLIGSA